MRIRRIIIVMALLLMAGGIVAFCLLKFHDLRERNLIKLSRALVGTGDLRGAYLFAQQARQLRPRDPVPLELLGQIAEKERSPEAILRYQEIVELSPDKAAALEALANVAIRYDEIQIADEALSEVPEEKRKTVAYQKTAAVCAIKQGNLGAAEKDFKQAIALEPPGTGNKALQLDLATLYLSAGNTEVARSARATIESFRGDAELRLPALRALLADARARKDERAAEALALELKNDKGGSFADQLLYLETVFEAKDAGFDRELHLLQQETGVDASLVYTLLVWMNAHGMAAQSIAWNEAFSGRLKMQVPIRLATAEACTATGKWDELTRLTATNRKTDESWGALEFFRRAFRARAIVETGSSISGENFKHTWESALIATQGNTNALCMLARLVQGWGWKAQATQTWWLVARKNTGQTVALKELFLLASTDRDAAELYRVSRRIYQVRPADIVAKNNVAMLGMLIGEDTEEAHRLAAEIYRKYPNQPDIVSTYAFSLHLKGRDSEAVKLLGQLPGTVLQQPSIAICYGMVLSGAGQGDAARPVLQAALLRRSELFPQEITLAEKLLRDVSTATSVPN